MYKVTSSLAPTTTMVPWPYRSRGLGHPKFPGC